MPIIDGSRSHGQDYTILPALAVMDLPAKFLQKLSGWLQASPGVKRMGEIFPLPLSGRFWTAEYALDKDLPLYRVRTTKEHFSDSTVDSRLATVVTGVFATLALVLLMKSFQRMAVRVAVQACRPVVWLLLQTAR